MPQIPIERRCDIAAGDHLQRAGPVRDWGQCLPDEDPLGKAQTWTLHWGGSPYERGGIPYEWGIDFLLTYRYTLMRMRVDTPSVQYASPQA